VEARETSRNSVKILSGGLTSGQAHRVHEKEDLEKCKSCGRRGHGKSPNFDLKKANCGAFDHKCKQCSKKGHFKDFCPMKPKKCLRILRRPGSSMEGQPVGECDPESELPCSSPWRTFVDPPEEMPMAAMASNMKALEEFVRKHYKTSAFNTCKRQHWPITARPPMKIHTPDDAVPMYCSSWRS
jgi:hypothetical protein